MTDHKRSISIQEVDNGFLVSVGLFVFSTAIDLAEWVHDYFTPAPPPADAPDAPNVGDGDANQVTQ